MTEDRIREYTRDICEWPVSKSKVRAILKEFAKEIAGSVPKYTGNLEIFNEELNTWREQYN